MSNRNTILESFKTLLQRITKTNGYNFNVAKVVRKSLFWDVENSFPVLMVLGGGEEFDDRLDGTSISSMVVVIRGYSRDKDDPEVALTRTIEDVLTVLEDSAHNSYHDSMRILNLETDEGWLHNEAEGLGFFSLNVEVRYRFTRGAP